MSSRKFSPVPTGMCGMSVLRSSAIQIMGSGIGIYSIICGSKRVVRGMGFIKKGTAIFALSFRHGKIYQPMCL
jgi:hypothetical protein